MMDLIEIWNDLGRNFEKPHGLMKPDFIARHAARANFSLELLRPAQIQIRNDDTDTPRFEFHPRPDMASARSWTWVLAVREGAFFQAHGYREALKYGSVDDAERIENFVTVDAIIKRFHEDFSHLAAMECIGGDEIVDLVALSPDCTRVLGRFMGDTPVIGYPVNPLAMGFEHKIRLFRNVRTWLENLCGGAVLIGDARENLSWLQACEHGIITDNVAHGERIRKILLRPYLGPQILVAA